MHPVADVGLLKMDFLGLANLAILDRCVKLIAETTGEHMGVYDVPIDDKKTFEVLGEGETFGVFQLESTGMRRNIKELKPTTINDFPVTTQASLPSTFSPCPTSTTNSVSQLRSG